MSILLFIIALLLGILIGYILCLLRYIAEYTSLIEEHETREEQLQILKDELFKFFAKDGQLGDD
jgi:uncharacterized membrane-anchored protein YhcB (DUF1043 family)